MVRYLAGETGGDESARFEQWLEAAPGNRDLFDQYRKLWGEMDRVKSVSGLDLDAEWKKLESSLQEETTVYRLRRTSPVFILSRVAVAAVIVLALSLGGIYMSRNAGYQTVLTENDTRELVLPDGSSATLNAHSSLRYPKRFEKELRALSLEGEAFFEVERDEARPFTIAVDGIEVRVLGTSFNVSAYRGREDIEVIVSTGQVAVTKPGDIPESVILKPGNRGVYNRTDHSLVISRDIDRNYLSWKTRSFIFEDQPLIEVIQILNNVYGSAIVIGTDSLAEARITTSFNNQTLEAILNVLSATLDLEVKDEDGRILLTGEI
jgi:ferric-dicitrate binding protein FerR (iron transport regulator)